MIKKIVWIAILAFVICEIFAIVFLFNSINGCEITDKIEPMPFDSRLCTNTGKMHRYIVIGEKGAVIERYEPILDCTNLYKYNEGLK